MPSLQPHASIGTPARQWCKETDQRKAADWVTCCDRWRHANGLVGSRTFGEAELERLVLGQQTASTA